MSALSDLGTDSEPTDEDLLSGEYWERQEARLSQMTREQRSEWATVALTRLRSILANPQYEEILTEEAREHMNVMKAMLAGLAFSCWTPRGTLRKAIFYGLLAVAAVSVFHGSIAVAIVIALLALSMSPRIVGESMAIVGPLARFWWVIPAAILLYLWLK